MFSILSVFAKCTQAAETPGAAFFLKGKHDPADRG